MENADIQSILAGEGAVSGEFTHTFEDIREGYESYYRLRGLIVGSAGWVAFGVAVFASIAGFSQGLPIWIALIGWWLFVVWGPIGIRYRVRKIWKGFPQYHVCHHVTLSNDGIAYFSPESATLLRWPALGLSIETRNMFVLYYRGSLYPALFIPKRAFSEEGVDQCRRLIEKLNHRGRPAPPRGFPVKIKGLP